MTLRSIIRRIRRTLAYHEPLITVSISKENLLHNLCVFKGLNEGVRIAPMLKSNAYGHGLAVVAEILDKEDIAFFAVDSLFEAKTLRRSGIKSRITVMGYVRPEYIADSAIKNVDCAIVDLEQLRELARHAHKPVRVHLKLDTGMHRQGLLEDELPEAIELIKGNPHILVAGVCTHFADADSEDDTFTRGQIAVWDRMTPALLSAFPSIKYRHAPATKGQRFAKDTGVNVARIGIGLFGFDTGPFPLPELKPVLSMRSIITSIRSVPKGDSVGYNTTYTAERPIRVATVPVGYYEGLDRALSSKGSMQVRGVSAPIVGRVSMNMSSIEVTDIPDASRGDEVTAISRNPSDPNSVLSMAKLAGTIPYVILVHIPIHLRRVVE